ncbi:hypothetical protein OAM69_07685 [bacterium]|nr:hypothetical protein [bacterium]
MRVKFRFLIFTRITVLTCVAVCAASLVYADGADELVPSNSGNSSQQEGVSGLSSGYTESSEIDRLRNELKSHLASNPNCLQLVLEKSSQLLDDKLFEDADRYIRSALQDYPNSSDLLVRHAEALAGMNGGALDGEAFEILSRSLDNDHNHKPSLWLMALSNQQVGNHDAALIILNALKQQIGEESEFVEVVDRSIAVSISYIDHMNNPQKKVK